MKKQKCPTPSKASRWTWLCLSGPLLGFSGCAGPSTPLGAVWAYTPEQARGTLSRLISPGSQSGPKIHFTPSRQVLHGPSRMRVVIEDLGANFTDYELAVHYNGLDVSRAFLNRARVLVDPQLRKIVIENPDIKLSAVDDHQIEILYRSSSGSTAYARYDTPECYLFKLKPVENLADFNPSPALIRLIDRVSRDQGVNPAFSTGLVAQESGFHTRVVSWAKAVGLTQVTPLAEAEILDRYPDWPRYPGFNTHPVPMMRALIMSGEVNSKNEWRLNQEKSIQGGIEYAVMLAKRWSTPDNLERIRAISTDIEAAQTQLILASYHSGYARVNGALSRLGKRWLQARELGEAKKYVNRIRSYCSYFSEKESLHENAS